MLCSALNRCLLAKVQSEGQINSNISVLQSKKVNDVPHSDYESLKRDFNQYSMISAFKCNTKNTLKR